MHDNKQDMIDNILDELSLGYDNQTTSGEKVSNNDITDILNGLGLDATPNTQKDLPVVEKPFTAPTIPTIPTESTKPTAPTKPTASTTPTTPTTPTAPTHPIIVSHVPTPPTLSGNVDFMAMLEKKELEKTVLNQKLSTGDIIEPPIAVTPVVSDTKEFATKKENFELPIELEPIKQDTLSSFNLNHGVEQEDFRKFFSAPIAVDEIAAKAATKKPSMKFPKKLPVLSRKIPEDELSQTQQFEQTPIEETEQDFDDISDEYINHSDDVIISKNLSSKKVNLTLKIVFLSVLTIISVYICLSHTVPFLPGADVTSDEFKYIVSNVVVVFAGMAICFPQIINGVMSAFSKPSVDIFPTMVVLASLLHLIVLMFNVSSPTAPSVIVFSSIALLSLLFSCVGKRMQMSVAKNNFSQIIQNPEYSVSFIVENKELTKKVTEGLMQDDPQLLVTKKTNLLQDFMKNSFSVTQSDKKANKLSLAIIIMALVCGVVTFLFTKDILLAVTAFTATICLTAPLSSSLIIAIPTLLMHNAAAKVGANIIGASGVEEICETNVVMSTAKDIFPTGSVRLSGIKTFEKERIDLAILYATSLLIEGCETLKDIFLSVIDGNLSMLYSVENLTKEIGYGVVGWIDNNRVIVGNREMMLRHEIEVPSLDYELRYTKGEKMPMYLSVSGKLFAMFLVKYSANNEVGGMLEDLSHSNVSLLINSEDFNISSTLIEKLYDLRPQSVKIMTQSDIDALKPSLAYAPKSTGAMKHLDSFSSLLGGLYAASSARDAEKSANIIQLVGAIIAMVVVVLLTVVQSITSFTLTAALLFVLAWLLLAVAIPLLRKY